MIENILSLRKIKNRPLILDGAIGSVLQDKSLISNSKLWSTEALIKHPDAIRAIHTNYIKSGAEIITTNTFRTNPFALRNTNYKSQELVNKAFQLANIDDKIIIAGCNPPAEDCYSSIRTINISELTYNHQKHIDILMSAGVDFILNETQSHLDEITIICKYCVKNCIPFVMSLYLTEDLKILSGEDISSVLSFLQKNGASLISFNCVSKYTFEKLQKLIKFEFPWGVYLNCGLDGAFGSDLICDVSPKNYASFINNNIDDNCVFAGACCGSGFEHIKLLKEILVEQN